LNLSTIFFNYFVTYLGGKVVASVKMKAKPITKKTVEYFDVDSKYCNNCSRASAEYKKICPVCKGTGHVKIPLKKEKNEYDKLVSGFEEGTNEIGFAGLPGAYRPYTRSISQYELKCGYWWSSTEYNYNSINALNFELLGYKGIGVRGDVDKKDGLSVRCIRD
jgi:hypothetical protein